jgi:sporulation protein YlmC with PRC-barrel domain
MHMNYEDRDAYGIYHRSTEGGPGPDLMGANTLIGNEVYNHKSEDLGDIKEIMLDVRNGKVRYAVLSFGGFLGMGKKLFAVPWAALTLDTTNKRFVLKVEKEKLTSAPGFDKDKWPDMADRSWSEEIHAYYEVEPDPDATPV